HPPRSRNPGTHAGGCADAAWHTQADSDHDGAESPADSYGRDHPVPREKWPQLRPVFQSLSARI
ncbi:hypothetical protein JZ751_022898, partial [Albula glossodonta]